MSQWIRPTTRWAVYLRDGMQCTYCQVTLRDLVDERGWNFLTLDHFKPRSKGGRNDPENVVSCCYACNITKGRRSLASYCDAMGLGYNTVKSRARDRRRKPIEPYQEAARVLLGQLPGVPPAPLVVDHDWLVKKQWQHNEDIEGWEHLGEQNELFCKSCGAPLDRDGIHRPPGVPF